MIHNSLPLVGFTALFSIYNSLSLFFSFHCLIIPSSSNCLAILCVDHTDTSRSSFQICLWFKEKYYHTARPSKMHPVAHHHPQWHPSNCKTMVQLYSWKKIDTRRCGSLLLPFWRTCMGIAHQKRYWMGQQRDQLRRLSYFIVIFNSLNNFPFLIHPFIPNLI